MFSTWLLITSSLIYIGMLFAVAYYGDRRIRQGKTNKYRAVIYSLSLGVYCTSWTYYGAVGKATEDGWEYAAILIGPIISIFLGYRLLRKIAILCNTHNITSIADFIASRYGKTQSLAVIVTIIAILGTLPYIALQLKAVTLSFDVLATNAVAAEPYVLADSLWNDTGLIVAILMALFTILFGTRYVNASEHHEGIILAIAFESVIKLLALACICTLAIGISFISVDLVSVMQNSQTPMSSYLIPSSFDQDFLTVGFVSQTMLAMVAIFCLPRQFHVTFVENTDPEHLKNMRWLFPLYLLITMLLIIPITNAGMKLFEGQNVHPDMYVLAIPMVTNHNYFALFAYLGGLSASTSMVIVAVMALSTMLCNDIIMPLLLNWKRLGLRDDHDMTGLLLHIRRYSILVILALSYLYYRYISSESSLSSVGLVAFVAAMQFFPAVIGGLVWKHGHRNGAMTGMLAGFAIWIYTLFLPSLVDTGNLPSSFIEHGLFGFELLKPYELFGVDFLDPITHSFVWTMMFNVGFYFYFSVTSTATLTDRIQAAQFTQRSDDKNIVESIPWWSSIEVSELRLLAERFIGVKSTAQAFENYTNQLGNVLTPSEKADSELVEFTENLLAGAIGASSARLVIKSILKKKDMPIEDIVSIVNEASEAIQFNQALLNATIENIDQGISVVDRNLCIVGWNSRYLEIFGYPPGFIYVGKHVRDILRHNVERGECGPGEINELIEKRVAHLSSGASYTFLRYREDGTVLEIKGNRMPEGGYVTSYTDITEHKKTERALIEINETLEQRVKKRTQELSRLNAELRSVSMSKTRYLAAVNHDLMQPLNAARLFTSALQQNIDDPQGLTSRIANSLHSAEEILNTLLDISKMDSGILQAKFETFPICRVLNKLHEEFSVIGAQRDLKLFMHPCSLNVYSDPHLLRRVLQNFISNALRYTREGRVVIGCRRLRMNSSRPMLRVEVWDTGIGISDADLDRIFNEFERLDNLSEAEEKGLGLGLAISKRIANMLQHHIGVRSRLEQGSMFSLLIPISTEQVTVVNQSNTQPDNVPGWQSMDGLNVLCIDNDPDILDAMQLMLKNWSCQCFCAKSLSTALEKLNALDVVPDIMLVDYNLDNNENGIDTMDVLQSHFDQKIPGVLITAEISPETKQSAQDAGYRFLRKPLNPGALRNLIVKLTGQRRLMNNVSDTGS